MKMKIGIVCYPSIGGSGIVATELGKLLAERGHEIHFISSSLPFRLNRLNPNIYYHEVDTNQYSVFKYPPYDLALASKIAEIIEREELDIIHAHYAIPHAACAYLAKKMVQDKVKIITTLHGTDITVLGSDPSLTNVIRFSIEQSDIVTAVSESLAHETLELIEPKKEIQTIYNFIDERIYRKREDCQPLKDTYGISENEKVMIHISNFRAVKRVQDVIKVFHRVLQECSAKLLLVGDGPESTVICKLVRKLGIQDKVLFLGKQENVEELLSISDVKILTSEKESFGLVLLEAMACGVPCVGTNVGGIPEVIVDGETGYICEVGNIEQLSEKTLDILKNDSITLAFSQNSITRVRDFFSSEAIVEQYEQAYQTLLEVDKNE